MYIAVFTGKRYSQVLLSMAFAHGFCPVLKTLLCAGLCPPSVLEAPSGFGRPAQSFILVHCPFLANISACQIISVHLVRWFCCPPEGSVSECSSLRRCQKKKTKENRRWKKFKVKVPPMRPKDQCPLVLVAADVICAQALALFRRHCPPPSADCVLPQSLEVLSCHLGRLLGSPE